MGKLMTPQRFRLRGKSSVSSGDGTLLATLNSEPACSVVEIIPGKEEALETKIPSYHGWIHPGSGFLRNVIIPLDVAIGGMVYNANRRKTLSGAEWKT